MRFMVMVPANEEYEAGALPDAKLLGDMVKFNEEMVEAGVMLAGEGLHPTSKGARLEFSGGKCTVIDGPFAESKELIAGFWLIRVNSREEAIAWMKRAPVGDGVLIEIRQVFEMDDFGSVLTPELRERDARCMDLAAENVRQTDDDKHATQDTARSRLPRGQVCYLQIPASDPMKSAEFYEKVLGWHIERPYPSFEAPGLIGQWVSDRPPASDGGLLAWISVDNIDESLDAVGANGGAVIEPPSRDGPRWLATIRDPGGNVVGIAQHGPRSKSTE